MSCLRWKLLGLSNSKKAVIAYALCSVRIKSLAHLLAEPTEVHHFVECLDRYFGNVCELDLIFNFHKAFASFAF